MANALYPECKRALLKKEIDLENDSITCAIIDNAYAFDPTHIDYSVSIVGNEVDTIILANKQVLNTANNAVFEADDPTYVAVAVGPTVGAVVLYHTVSSIPIIFIDDGAGLPFPTNGGDITISFSNGTNRIFAL